MAYSVKWRRFKEKTILRRKHLRYRHKTSTLVRTIISAIMQAEFHVRTANNDAREMDFGLLDDGQGGDQIGFCFVELSKTYATRDA